MALGTDVEKMIEEQRKEKGYPKMSWSELAKHNSQGDCYIVISNVVFNVTSYLKRHPGGEVAILRHAGKDATTFFNKVSSHTTAARKNLVDLYVADIGSSFLPSLGSKKPAAGHGKKGSDSSCSCVVN